MAGETQARITGFQLYQFDDPRDLPYGSCAKEGSDCRYGVLLIGCAGRTGWGESLLTENRKYFDLAQWASFLQAFHKPTIEEAYATLDKHQSQWGPVKAGLVRSALDDLRQRIDNDGGRTDGPRNADELYGQCIAHYAIV